MVLHAEDNEISRDSKPHRTPRKEVTLVTANARCTEIVVGSLAKSTEGKRRSLVWDTRPGRECISGLCRKSLLRPAIDGAKRRSFSERARAIGPGLNTSIGCIAEVCTAVCLRVIGDPTEAEDLTQEAFLLLFRKIHTFRGESAFSAWPQRLAVSVVLEATPDPEDEMLTGWWLRWR